jgi:hypothetical protein
MNIVICFGCMHYLGDDVEPIDYRCCLSNHYECMIKSLQDAGRNLTMISCAY